MLTDKAKYWLLREGAKLEKVKLQIVELLTKISYVHENAILKNGLSLVFYNNSIVIRKFW